MNTSSNNRFSLKSDIEKILGVKIYSINRLNPSGNSQSYLIKCEKSKDYKVKIYFVQKEKPVLSKRMITEYESLKFLWKNHVRAIARPIAMEKEKNYSIFEYIRGERSDIKNIKDSDVDQILEFIEILFKISKRGKNKTIGNAAEACFSIKDIITNLQSRFDRLKIEAKRIDEKGNELKRFLFQEFIPIFQTIKDRSKKEAEKYNIRLNFKLENRFRTLSPSDIGFHNAIRKSSGKIIFLDFEYFGFDDPAKLISDMLLHPQMALNIDLKTYFVKKALEIFKDDPKIINRLKIVFPLWGLKWCLIMLNEFLPTDYKRREFAAGKKLDMEKVLNKQLEDAKKLLNLINSGYNKFPYKI